LPLFDGQLDLLIGNGFFELKLNCDIFLFSFDTVIVLAIFIQSIVAKGDGKADTRKFILDKHKKKKQK
jgi:hypothetical protein